MLKISLFGLSLISSVAAANTFDFLDTNQQQYGFEFNPVSLLASDSEATHVSLGFSIFQPEQSAEINFPVEYKKFKDSGEEFDVLNFGTQYRKFFDKGTEGFYFSATGRVSRLNSDATKLGLGLGLGYRHIFPSGLYWGYGFTVGRYIGNNDAYDYDHLSTIETIEDDEYMLDVEVFKIGMKF